MPHFPQILRATKCEKLSDLIFLNTFYAGASYTEGEHRAWLQAAGFVDIVREPFLLRDGLGSGLIIAHKREESGGTRT